MIPFHIVVFRKSGTDLTGMNDEYARQPKAYKPYSVTNLFIFNAKIISESVSGP